MSPHGPRDPVAGPDGGPEPPFPLRLSGKVVRGFGRGSKELGIPTANIPIEGLSVGGNEALASGIYYGWAGLDVEPSGAGAASDGAAADGEARRQGRGRVHAMVMSVGWNPYYKNEKRTVEVHVMHAFARDFYGSHLNLVVLGFVRPEYDYVSKEALIDDIRTDVEVARRSLDREPYAAFRRDRYLLTFPGEGGGDESKADVAS